MKYTLKQWRVLRGMTQKDLAEYLGVTESAVSQWENGTSAPRLKHLQAIAKIFGIEIGDIILPEPLT